LRSVKKLQVHTDIRKGAVWRNKKIMGLVSEVSHGHDEVSTSDKRL